MQQLFTKALCLCFNGAEGVQGVRPFFYLWSGVIRKGRSNREYHEGDCLSIGGSGVGSRH